MNHPSWQDHAKDNSEKVLIWTLIGFLLTLFWCGVFFAVVNFMNDKADKAIKVSVLKDMRKNLRVNTENIYLLSEALDSMAKYIELKEGEK